MNYCRFLIIFIISVTLAACSKEAASPTSGAQESDSTQPKAGRVVTLDVYKTPTCGCCGDWVHHVEQSGFNAQVEDQDSLNALKESLNIPLKARSCHVGVSKEGYFFEGHVPAKYIKQFLADPPKEALGLAVPGMPVGSPGMEMGERFDPYAVMLVKKDGSLSVYAELVSYDAQF